MQRRWVSARRIEKVLVFLFFLLSKQVSRSYFCRCLILFTLRKQSNGGVNKHISAKYIYFEEDEIPPINSFCCQKTQKRINILFFHVFVSGNLRFDRYHKSVPYAYVYCTTLFLIYIYISPNSSHLLWCVCITAWLQQDCAIDCILSEGFARASSGSALSQRAAPEAHQLILQ